MLDKLNKYPIDWCVNCGLTSTKNVKKMMFCYILIGYLRNSSSYYFSKQKDTYHFILDLSEWECKAVGNLKNKKSYYKCLLPILEEHLTNCGNETVRKFHLSLKGSILDISF